MKELTKMANKDSKKFWVRIACFVLAGLMIVGVATTAIFMIVEGLNHDHKHIAAYEQIEQPKYDEGWTF